MALPESFLSELKFRNPIAEVIGGYVQVSKIGRNLKCKCPFHMETDASLVIYTGNQTFYCFGCGAAGDVISFVRKIENIDYMSAITLLAERANLKVPERDGKDKFIDDKRKIILQVNKESARYFFSQFSTDEGKKALLYLKNRGLTNATIRRFGLGYSQDSWTGLRDFLLEKGFSEQNLIDAAVVAKRNKGNGTYDLFRKRVMFPIINIRGEVIGFGGRLLEGDGPKYLNSPDTLVFKKSRNLFAMNFAKSSKENNFILAEGYMDVIALHQAGFDSAVASLGTALTKEQVYLLSAYNKNVILSYDSDEPGKKATRRAIDIFDKSSISVNVVRMEGAKDPDEYIKKYSAEKYKLALEKSAFSTDYIMEEIKSKYNLKNTNEQLKYSKEVINYLNTLSDLSERDIYCGKLAEQLGIEKNTVLKQLKLGASSFQNNKYKKEYKNINKNNTKQIDQIKNLVDDKKVKNFIRISENAIILLLYKSPLYYNIILNELTSDMFSIEYNKKLFSVMMNILSETDSIDISKMSEKLTEQEISQFVYMLDADKFKESNMIDFSEEGLKNYITVLKTKKPIKAKKI